MSEDDDYSYSDDDFEEDNAGGAAPGDSSLFASYQLSDEAEPTQRTAQDDDCEAGGDPHCAEGSVGEGNVNERECEDTRAERSNKGAEDDSGYASPDATASPTSEGGRRDDAFDKASEDSPPPSPPTTSYSKGDSAPPSVASTHPVPSPRGGSRCATADRVGCRDDAPPQGRAERRIVEPSRTVEPSAIVDQTIRRLRKQPWTPLITGPIRIWRDQANLLKKVTAAEERRLLKRCRQIAKERDEATARSPSEGRGARVGDAVSPSRSLRGMQAGYRDDGGAVARASQKVQQTAVSPSLRDVVLEQHSPRKATAKGSRNRETFLDRLPTLHASPGPMYHPSVALVRPQAGNVKFSCSRRVPDIGMRQGFDTSPGPVYKHEVSWKAGTARQVRPHINKRNVIPASSRTPGPGEYATTVPKSRGPCAFMTREVRDPSRHLMNLSAANHIGPAMSTDIRPLLRQKTHHTARNERVACLAKQIELTTQAYLNAGIGVGDAYSDVPLSCELDSDDEAVLKDWGAMWKDDVTA
eukprot:Sspe_Gene.71991::Locus_42811_Transcript_1_1_Confidence_1.000_Length_1722::g.71991::m.71991